MCRSRGLGVAAPLIFVARPMQSVSCPQLQSVSLHHVSTTFGVPTEPAKKENTFNAIFFGSRQKSHGVAHHADSCPGLSFSTQAHINAEKKVVTRPVLVTGRPNPTQRRAKTLLRLVPFLRASSIARMELAPRWTSNSFWLIDARLYTYARLRTYITSVE